MTYIRINSKPMKTNAVMAYRTPNYTHEQKLYFLQRIQGVLDAVQDFRKDTNAMVQRNAAWNELLIAFNAAFPDRPPSTLPMLKTLWKRLKVESRNALIRRQEQLAAGIPALALTEIQREVTSMVPSLIVKLENTIDADVIVNAKAVQETGSCAAAASGSDQEDVCHSQIDVIYNKMPFPDSPNRAHSCTIAGSSTSSYPDLNPRPAPSTTAQGGGPRRFLDSRFEARMLELSEREHELKTKLLLAQHQMLDDKRKALKQKEKAYRYKKRYYRTKLQSLGAEVESSSGED